MPAKVYFITWFWATAPLQIHVRAAGPTSTGQLMAAETGAPGAKTSTPMGVSLGPTPDPGDTKMPPAPRCAGGVPAEPPAAARQSAQGVHFLIGQWQWKTCVVHINEGVANEGVAHFFTDGNPTRSAKVRVKRSNCVQLIEPTGKTMTGKWSKDTVQQLGWGADGVWYKLPDPNVVDVQPHNSSGVVGVLNGRWQWKHYVVEITKGWATLFQGGRVVAQGAARIKRTGASTFVLNPPGGRRPQQGTWVKGRVQHLNWATFGSWYKLPDTNVAEFPLAQQHLPTPNVNAKRQRNRPAAEAAAVSGAAEQRASIPAAQAPAVPSATVQRSSLRATHVNTKEGRAAIGKLPAGVDFPRHPNTLSEILGDAALLGPDGQELAAREALNDQVYALYFSAYWCALCRDFTPKLAEWYSKDLKAKGLEVVFVSSDADVGSFKSHFEEQPWLALPYSDRRRKDQLNSHFGVTGIPTLVIVDKDGSTITKDGRSAVSGDPTGAEFPWHPASMNNASKGPRSLREVSKLFAPAPDFQGARVLNGQWQNSGMLMVIKEAVVTLFAKGREINTATIMMTGPDTALLTQTGKAAIEVKLSKDGGVQQLEVNGKVWHKLAAPPVADGQPGGVRELNGRWQYETGLFDIEDGVVMIWQGGKASDMGQIKYIDESTCEFTPPQGSGYSEELWERFKALTPKVLECGEAPDEHAVGSIQYGLQRLGVIQADLRRGKELTLGAMGVCYKLPADKLAGVQPRKCPAADASAAPTAATQPHSSPSAEEWSAVYINLARRGDRRAKLASTLAPANTALMARLARIDAVDGRYLDLGDRTLASFVSEAALARAREAAGRPTIFMDSQHQMVRQEPHLTKGAVACAMSHYAALLAVATNPVADWGLILEDDITGVVPNVHKAIASIVRRLPANWDAVFLGYHGGALHGTAEEDLQQDTLQYVKRARVTMDVDKRLAKLLKHTGFHGGFVGTVDLQEGADDFEPPVFRTYDKVWGLYAWLVRKEAAAAMLANTGGAFPVEGQVDGALSQWVVKTRGRTFQVSPRHLLFFSQKSEESMDSDIQKMVEITCQPRRAVLAAEANVGQRPNNPLLDIRPRVQLLNPNVAVERLPLVPFAGFAPAPDFRGARVLNGQWQNSGMLMVIKEAVVSFFAKGRERSTATIMMTGPNTALLNPKRKAAFEGKWSKDGGVQQLEVNGEVWHKLGTPPVADGPSGDARVLNGRWQYETGLFDIEDGVATIWQGGKASNMGKIEYIDEGTCKFTPPQGLGYSKEFRERFKAVTPKVQECGEAPDEQTACNGQNGLQQLGPIQAALRRGKELTLGAVGICYKLPADKLAGVQPQNSPAAESPVAPAAATANVPAAPAEAPDAAGLSPRQPHSSPSAEKWGAVYINLARRGDRRAKLASTLASENTALMARLARIDAVDGRSLDLGDRALASFVSKAALARARDAAGRPTIFVNSQRELLHMESHLTKGAVACAMSHYAALQAVAKNPVADWGLILEDDIVGVVPEVHKAIASILRRLPANWDAVFLGYHGGVLHGTVVDDLEEDQWARRDLDVDAKIARLDPRVADLHGGFVGTMDLQEGADDFEPPVFRTYGEIWGLYAWMVRKEAAIAMLAGGFPVAGQVDRHLSQWVVTTRGRTFKVSPRHLLFFSPKSEDAMDSDIQTIVEVDELHPTA